MKSTAKKVIAALLNHFYPRHARQGNILMYHSIGSNDKFSTVTIKDFDWQMRYLREQEYAVIPLRDLISRIRAKEDVSGCVSLTFDDGYHDFYTQAFPILKKYELPATVFVTTGFIDGKMKTKQGQVFTMMSREELIKLSKTSFIDVMPHTVTHPKFTEIEFEEAIKEIESSRAYIEVITDGPADIFAYPFGAYTAELAEYIRTNATWLGAVSIQPGFVSPQSDIALLKRNSIDSGTNKTLFKMKISEALSGYLKLSHA